MIAAFHKSVMSLLPASEDVLLEYLHTMQPRDWAPLAELFAARLPEFDAVIALPDSAAMAEQVAQMRGVPLLRAQHSPAGLTLNLEPPVEGEALLLSTHLKSGEVEFDLIRQARAHGLRVTVVGAAVERTSLGARSRLSPEGVTVRAALQIADTPRGLTQERRTPDRWSVSASA